MTLGGDFRVTENSEAISRAWLIALPNIFIFAQHGRMIPVPERVPMKHLVGIGALVALAFILRSWPYTNLGLDIYIHDSYWVVQVKVIGFWCLVETAFTWALVFAWTSVRRHS